MISLWRKGWCWSGKFLSNLEVYCFKGLVKCKMRPASSTPKICLTFYPSPHPANTNFRCIWEAGEAAPIWNQGKRPCRFVIYPFSLTFYERIRLRCFFHLNCSSMLLLICEESLCIESHFMFVFSWCVRTAKHRVVVRPDLRIDWVNSPLIATPLILQVSELD